MPSLHILLCSSRFAEYCDERVCGSVGLYSRISQEPHGRTFRIFVHVAYGCGSVLPWWHHCSTLCTFGFVNDITFSCSYNCNGPCGSMTLQQQFHFTEVHVWPNAALLLVCGVGCVFCLRRCRAPFLYARGARANMRCTVAVFKQCCWSLCVAAELHDEGIDDSSRKTASVVSSRWC